MRTFLEIIYNCPFILLIVFTSLAFVTFFDGEGNRRTGQELAVFQLFGDGEKAGDGEKKLTKIDEIENKIGQSNDSCLERSEERRVGKECP